jgi:hypothetical protein
MLQPLPVSVSVTVTVPEIVTGTIFPFGGHKDAGVVESVIVGAVVQKGELFSSTPRPNPVVFTTTTSGLPSLFKSPAATEKVPPPESKVTAGWNVPSPLPVRTPTAR